MLSLSFVYDNNNNMFLESLVSRIQTPTAHENDIFGSIMCVASSAWNVSQRSLYYNQCSSRFSAMIIACLFWNLFAA